MKVNASIKKRCKYCTILRRRGRVWRICKRYPKHKGHQ